jgi:hypothetical protein
MFLHPSNRGGSVAAKYRTDAAPIPDVLALRPFRKAVIGAKEVGRELPHR